MTSPKQASILWLILGSALLFPAESTSTCVADGSTCGIRWSSPNCCSGSYCVRKPTARKLQSSFSFWCQPCPVIANCVSYNHQCFCTACTANFNLDHHVCVPKFQEPGLDWPNHNSVGLQSVEDDWQHDADGGRQVTVTVEKTDGCGGTNTEVQKGTASTTYTTGSKYITLTPTFSGQAGSPAAGHVLTLTVDGRDMVEVFSPGTGATCSLGPITTKTLVNGPYRLVPNKQHEFKISYSTEEVVDNVGTYLTHLTFAESSNMFCGTPTLHCSVVDGHCTCIACESGYSASGYNKCCSTVPNCSTYDRYCNCKTCNTGWTMLGGNCCKQIPNCSTQGQDCKCKTCAQAFQLVGEGASCCQKVNNATSYNPLTCAVTACAQGYDLSENQCCKHIDQCSSYDSSCKCHGCANTYDLFENKCCKHVENCNKYGSACACAGCEENFNLVAEKCCAAIDNCLEQDNTCSCTSCAATHRLKDGTCRAKVANCADYSPETDKCTKCITGFDLSGEQCCAAVDRCAEYDADCQCTRQRECDYMEGCIDMNDQNCQCLSCDNGYKLTGGLCLYDWIQGCQSYDLADCYGLWCYCASCTEDYGLQYSWCYEKCADTPGCLTYYDEELHCYCQSCDDGYAYVPDSYKCCPDVIENCAQYNDGCECISCDKGSDRCNGACQSRCLSGQYETTACGATQNRVCTQCTELTQSDCPDGQYLHKCGGNHDAFCSVCPAPEQYLGEVAVAACVTLENSDPNICIFSCEFAGSDVVYSITFNAGHYSLTDVSVIGGGGGGGGSDDGNYIAGGKGGYGGIVTATNIDLDFTENTVAASIIVGKAGGGGEHWAGAAKGGSGGYYGGSNGSNSGISGMSGAGAGGGGLSGIFLAAEPSHESAVIVAGGGGGGGGAALNGVGIDGQDGCSSANELTDSFIGGVGTDRGSEDAGGAGGGGGGYFGGIGGDLVEGYENPGYGGHGGSCFADDAKCAGVDKKAVTDASSYGGISLDTTRNPPDNNGNDGRVSFKFQFLA